MSVEHGQSTVDSESAPAPARDDMDRRDLPRAPFAADEVPMFAEAEPERGAGSSGKRPGNGGVSRARLERLEICGARWVETVRGGVFRPCNTRECRRCAPGSISCCMSIHSGA